MKKYRIVFSIFLALCLDFSARADVGTPTEIQMSKGAEFIASVMDAKGNLISKMDCQAVGCWFPPCYQCQSQDKYYVFSVGDYNGVTAAELAGSLCTSDGKYSAACPKVDLDQAGQETCSLSGAR